LENDLDEQKSINENLTKKIETFQDKENESKTSLIEENNDLNQVYISLLIFILIISCYFFHYFFNIILYLFNYILYFIIIIIIITIIILH